MTRREWILPEPPFLRVFVVIILAIAAMFTFDTFLAKMERSESAVEAARNYEDGQRLMKQGDHRGAAESFQSALAIQRENQDYRLALGEAQLAEGKLADAEATLADLLQRNPFGGAANLAMARVMAKEGKQDDAEAYYHRAIYGQWKDDARGNQVKVRFELADLLQARRSKEELLAELLPLEQEASADLATREKLGRLFIAAGSANRAAETFQQILRQQPQDPEAHAGLGEAEFARGNYRSAQTEFLAALRLRPGDPDTRARLELCNRVLDLDPTRRGLSAAEQLQRSRNLVAMLADRVQQCSGEEVPKARNAGLEDNLNQAEQLWRVRNSECKQPIGADEEPLALVLAKLAQ